MTAERYIFIPRKSFKVQIGMKKQGDKILPPRSEGACRVTEASGEKITPGKIPYSYNAFPRDCTFAYMTPGYYATGFRILDVYKTKADFTEMKSLFFLEDPKKVEKWGNLKSRIPFPEGRVTDLPGTREVHYNNYCLRSLTPESTSSWRKSIAKLEEDENLSCNEEEEEEYDNEDKECVC